MVEVDVLPTYNVSSAVKSVVEAPPFKNDRPLTVRVPPTVSVVGLNDPAVSVPLTFKFVVVASPGTLTSLPLPQLVLLP